MNKSLRNIVAAGLISIAGLGGFVAGRVSSPEITAASILDKTPGYRTIRIYRSGFSGDLMLKERNTDGFFPMTAEEVTEMLNPTGSYILKEQADRARRSIYANK